MTPDTWERRAIGYGAGYNNPPVSGPVFTVTYDSINDYILVESTQPIFGATTNINLQGDAGNFALTVADFAVDDATHLHITGGEAYGPEVTQLDFLAGVTLQGIWTGSVIVAPAVSQISTSTYGTWYNASDVGGGNWSCSIATGAVAEPGIFVYVDNPTPDIDGMRVVGTDEFGDPWQMDFVLSLDPTPFKYGGNNPSSGYFIIGDTQLNGKTIAQVGALDNTGTLLGGLVANNFFWPTVQGAGPDGTYDAAIYFSQNPGVIPQPVAAPTSVTVTECLGGVSAFFQNYYDPTGPNAGLNPGTATIVQWDTDSVLINDTAMPASYQRIEASFAQGGVGGGNGGEYEVYGDPIPVVV